jgi:hypothetical protein
VERQKQVKTSAVVKAESFLNSVYLKIGKGDIFSLDALAREFKLTGTFATVLKRKNIVQKADNTKESAWIWLYPTKPDKSLALTIMDEVNRHNGAFGASSLKRALNQSERIPDLFSQKTQDEIMLLSATLNFNSLLTIYSIQNPSEEISEELITRLNEKAIFATKDLLTQIHKPKSQQNE